MADLDKVVDLDPVGDHGCIQCTAVHCGVRADLDIVSDLQTADLREFVKPSRGRVGDKPEAVAAQDRARLDDDPVAHRGARANHHARDQLAVGANHHAGRHDRSGADAASRANPRAGADDRELTHRRGGVDLG